MAAATTRARRPRPTRRAKPRATRRLGRDTYHHGDLRRALIDAAVAIIADRGAEAFTLREAARRLGVNHRAAYRHFADKARLLAAVAEQGLTGLIEGARAEIAAARASDPEARLVAMARAYVAFAARHPAHFRVMFGPRLDGGFDQPLAEAYQLLEAEIRGAVGAAVPAGEVSDAAIAYWSTLHGLASLVLMQRVRAEELRVERIVRRVLRGLR